MNTIKKNTESHKKTSMYTNQSHAADHKQSQHYSNEMI